MAVRVAEAPIQMAVGDAEALMLAVGITVTDMV
jgi:hypothetical protein